MRKIKFIFLLFGGILAIPGIAVARSSTDEVTLVVSADGATKEEATNMALRSAVEQAFGAFVSSNTTVLNDELVKDEIATISSGNVTGFQETACEQMPDGRFYVTLRATVSVKKLVSYAQSKGVEVEFSGALFAANLKLIELNRINEAVIMAHLREIIAKVYPLTLDFKLTVGDPYVVHGPIPIPDGHGGHMTVTNSRSNDHEKLYVKVPFTVTVVPNISAKNLENYIYETLNSIKMSKQEIEEYGRMKYKVYPLKERVDWFLYNSLYKTPMNTGKKGIKGVWSSVGWQKTPRLANASTRLDIPLYYDYWGAPFHFKIVGNNGEVLVDGAEEGKGTPKTVIGMLRTVPNEFLFNGYIPKEEIEKYTGFELIRTDVNNDTEIAQ